MNFRLLNLDIFRIVLDREIGYENNFVYLYTY